MAEQSTFQMINKNFTLILIAVLAIGGGYYFNKSKNLEAQINGTVAGVADTIPEVKEAAPEEPQGPTPDQLQKAGALSETDHVRGNKDAKVVLVEYSDYECPYCSRFHGYMIDVIEEMGDQVAWVYRHYPLSFHPNAQKSAEGAECVAKLAGNEAFWTYSDAIEETNSTDGKLSPEAIEEAAAATGVDMTAFKSCLDSDEMATKVKKDFSIGSAAGVTGTPGTIVFVDGEAQELIPGALPVESIKATVQKYL